MHGGYHFQQTGGNDVQLWGNDTELAGSVNDANFVKLATGTAGATWQCTDNLGFAYCLTSVNDTVIKTDGSSANTTFQDGTIPKGTIITSTPLQLVVGGVSGSPSTVNFSANNNFTSFTVGPLPTDPFTEIINAPGSRITHLAYYFGKVFWWKDQSFGYISGFGNQNTVTITIVSNQIGTLDNSSAFWNGTTFESDNKFSSGASPNGQMLGGIFFRGQDNHIYLYDGYSLTRITRVITPTITTASRRKANQWTQSSQSDFQGGVSTPAANISLTVSPGDVTVSSFQVISTSVAFASFSSTNLTISSNGLMITTNSVAVANNSFESGISTNWTDGGSSWGTASSVSGTSGGCTITAAQDGTLFADASTTTGGWTLGISVINAQSSVLIASTSFVQGGGSCAWIAKSLPMPSSANKKRVKIVLSGDNGVSSLTSDTFILNGSSVNFWVNTTQGGALGILKVIAVDYFTGNFKSSITSGTITSGIYDTGFTSSTVEIQSDFSSDSSTPTFQLLHSTSSTGGWAVLAVSTGTNTISNRYLMYSSSISAVSDSANTVISTITLIARSTGTYYSAVNNAPNLTSWSTFGANDLTPGNSAITYYVRVATGAFSVGSSTVAWVQQTKNATVNYSTGTYFQMRADFALTAATETPTISDFQFNWYEGSAADKSYITYFNDGIWISESSGTATSTDNVIYRLDLLNNAWLQDSIPANGFLVENNQLYFGDPTAPKVYRFGGVTTDNGNAIRSYWKSKDFAGDDPTVQNEYIQSDFIFNSVLSTATYTYMLDQSSSTAVSLALYSTASNTVKRGLLLARGRIGTFYNFSVGDNSSNPAWKLLMHKIHYNSLNWRGQTN